jgi:hypothetical protein
MEKQPNSRMCFVCGIDNPIGLKLKFYTDDEGRCIARFRPKPEHQVFPASFTGGSSPPYGLPSSSFCTLWRSRCMTEYYCTLGKQEVESLAQECRHFFRA